MAPTGWNKTRESAKMALIKKGGKKRKLKNYKMELNKEKKKVGGI